MNEYAKSNKTDKNGGRFAKAVKQLGGRVKNGRIMRQTRGREE